VQIFGSSLLGSTGVQAVDSVTGATAPMTNVHYASDTEIDADVPPGESGHTVFVRVTTLAGTNADNANDQFLYRGPGTSFGLAAAQPSPEPKGTTIRLSLTGAQPAACTLPEFQFQVTGPDGAPTALPDPQTRAATGPWSYRDWSTDTNWFPAGDYT